MYIRNAEARALFGLVQSVEIGLVDGAGRRRIRDQFPQLHPRLVLTGRGGGGRRHIVLKGSDMRCGDGGIVGGCADDPFDLLGNLLPEFPKPCIDILHRRVQRAIAGRQVGLLLKQRRFLLAQLHDQRRRNRVCHVGATARFEKLPDARGLGLRLGLIALGLDQLRRQIAELLVCQRRAVGRVDQAMLSLVLLHSGVRRARLKSKLVDAVGQPFRGMLCRARLCCDQVVDISVRERIGDMGRFGGRCGAEIHRNDGRQTHCLNVQVR